MAAIMQRLRTANLMIAAQVHTHPREAFHSRADDTWAIVRHAGALSIVLPDFARNTTPTNFFSTGAVYECTAEGAWTQVTKLDDCVELVP